MWFSAFLDILSQTLVLQSVQKYLISVSHHSFIKQKQHRLKAYVSAAYQFLMGPKPTSVPKVVTLIAPIFLLCDKLR